MLLTGFCVHSGTVAPPAIKQAVNYPTPATSRSAQAGSLSPLSSSESPLCSSSKHGVPATPVLMLLVCPAELSPETKPPHFVAFQLHAAPALLIKVTSYASINICIYFTSLLR